MHSLKVGDRALSAWSEDLCASLFGNPTYGAVKMGFKARILAPFGAALAREGTNAEVVGRREESFVVPYLACGRL